MKSLKIRMAAALFITGAFVSLSGCAPSNQLIPLRGEDPDSLMQSGARIGWLRKTGATRAVEAFRTALMDEKYADCLRLLGPATLAILKSRAASLKTDRQALLARGGVEGLGLRGAKDPINALRSEGAIKLKEDRPFDPTRTRATVIARFEGRTDPVEIPAMFTQDGWRIELVRISHTGLEK
ncbi:MAG: hypothetical protein GXP54_01060 [Deltaproteobacteria bacterium]|nr:hypothetical protein [Deltaproteobacteria bacterium]